MGITTIQISTETWDMLKNLGPKGKTYDEIIRDLIDNYLSYLQHLEYRLDHGEFRPFDEVVEEIEAELRQTGRTQAKASRKT
jgi:UTP:GlnB (protein PII) uridylyltransferase